MPPSTRTPPAASVQLSRRTFLRAGAALTSGAVLPGFAARAQTAVDITTTDLGGIKVLAGAGSNVLALRGETGALLVDGGLAANADGLLRAAYAATGNDRVRLLINTHWHPEQTGANEIVGRGGGTILAQEKTALYLGSTVYRPVDGSLVPVAPLPDVARPRQVVRGDGSLDFSGQRIDYGYLPAAHTDGDLYVHFPQLKVLAVGGVLAGDRWPVLDYRNGAWLGGAVRAVDWLAKLVTADTRVVPAQGPLLTGRDVMRQNGIYQGLFETMIAYMNKGYGAEDAVRVNPLAQYQAEFGDASVFLDAAYRSMLLAYVPD